MSYEILPDDEQQGGFEILPAALKQPKSPDKALSAAERFVHNLWRRPVDAGTQFGAQANRVLAEKGIVPRLKNDPSAEIAERERQYQEGTPEGVDWAGMAGSILSPVNLALMAIPGGPALKTASTLAKVAKATAPATLGAAGAITAPVADEENFWTEKAKQAGAGAIGGSVVNVGGRAVSRMLSPNASRNVDLQRLRQEGVEPTIGQAVGGTLGRAEEALTSVPILGNAIGKARGRALESFNRAAINRATKPVGQKVDEVGTEGIAQAGDKVGAAYDAARTLLANGARLDRPAIAEIRKVQSAVSKMGDNEQRAFERLMGEIGTDFTPTGRIRDFKRVDSTIGKKAAALGGSQDAYQRELGDQVLNLQNAVKSSVMRRNPQAGVLNTMGDEGWANLVRVEGAGVAGKDKGGIFTPGQLLTAVRSSDKSVRDRATARGEGLMQDLAVSGQKVLGNKTPDSGTPTRLGWGVGALGSGYGMAVEPFTTAAIISGLAAGSLAYTPAVQRKLVQIVAARGPGAQEAAELLRRFSAHSAVPAGVAAGNFFED